MNSDLSPELRWMLNSLKKYYQNRPFSGNKAIENFDTEKLWQLSVKHGIAAMLYQHVAAYGEKTVDLDRKMLQNWRSLYLRNTAKQLKRYAALQKIQEAFAERRIELILLKGMALSENYYRDIGLRPMGDIDLMIRPENRQSAARILQKAGFEKGEMAYISDFYQKQMTQIHHHLPTVKDPQTGIVAEIHWNILPPGSQYSLTMDSFWLKARKTTAGGVKCLTFCPEHLLLHVCLHSHENLIHGGFRLGWLADIAQILQKEKLRFDWHFFLENAIGFDVQQPVFEMLCLAEKYLAAAVPETIFEQLVPKPDYGFEKTFFDVLQNNEQNIAQNGQFLRELAQVTGLKNKVRLSADKIFPAREFMKKRYGVERNVLLPFVYVFRLFEIAGKVVSHFLGKKQT